MHLWSAVGKVGFYSSALSLIGRWKPQTPRTDDHVFISPYYKVNSVGGVKTAAIQRIWSRYSCDGQSE